MTRWGRFRGLHDRLDRLAAQTAVPGLPEQCDPELLALVEHGKRQANLREGLPADAPRPMREMTDRELAELIPDGLERQRRWMAARPDLD